MKKNGRLLTMLLAGALFAGTIFAGGAVPARADEDPEWEEAALEEAAAEEEAAADAEAELTEEDVPVDEAEAEDEELLEDLMGSIMEDAYINGITDRRYTGSAIKQTSMVVQHPDFEHGTAPFYLKEGNGYKVSYKNNTKAGTATVTFTGLDSIVGSVSKTFKITNSASWERLVGASGTGALGTQEKITQKFMGSCYAVIASNQNFQGAMMGVALAGMLKAPIFTIPKGTYANPLPDRVMSELARLGVKYAVIIGSEDEISQAAELQIEEMGISTFRTGKSGTVSERSASAGYVAIDDFESTSRTVIIATPKSFKDALSISPYAYATGSPIVFLDDDLTLSNKAFQFIDDCAFSQAILVGGPKAVPDSVKKLLLDGTNVSKITRLGGAGCYNTSRIIAEWEMGKLKNGTNASTGSLYKYVQVQFQPYAKHGINNVGISRGDGWKDALAGSALCGMYKSVILLADGTNQANTAVVKQYKKNIAKAYVFGGTQAVPKKVYDAFFNASK